MALTTKQLKDFEDILYKWRNELEETQQHNMREMHDQELVSHPDPADQASEETERNFDLRIQDRERRLIRKIDQALNRVKEGRFGVCDQCGGSISLKRLQARPVTTQCIDCKTEREQEERTRID